MRKENNESSRRKFIKHITASSIALGAGSLSAFALKEKKQRNA